ncbi:hypothetical protein V6R21_18805 [Limibacter armeniacum]|uniref:hypothetical protein n=1 Tax=Limibacter armeniacum TaxID=466084 RepID=UPI002FE660F9
MREGQLLLWGEDTVSESSYPQILIPEKILEIDKKEATVAGALPEPPAEPQKKVFPISKLMYSAFFLCAFLGIILLNNWILAFVCGVLGCAFVFLGTKRKVNNIRRHNEHLKELYNREMGVYRKALIHYEKMVKQMISPAEHASYRKKKKQEVISDTTEPTYLEREVNRGRAEAEFRDRLGYWFPGKIYTVFQLGNFEKPYVPDIVYKDHTGLHIDIEIDEPYSVESGEPIHYIGADDRRNRFFLENGWVVMRFSEEQVKRYPDSCCREIGQVLSQLKHEPIRDGLNKVRKLPAQKCWNKEEATFLAQNNYRNQLLNLEN